MDDAVDRAVAAFDVGDQVREGAAVEDVDDVIFDRGAEAAEVVDVGAHLAPAHHRRGLAPDVRRRELGGAAAHLGDEVLAHLVRVGAGGERCRPRRRAASGR